MAPPRALKLFGALTRLRKICYLYLWILKRFQQDQSHCNALESSPFMAVQRLFYFLLLSSLVIARPEKQELDGQFYAQ